MAENLICLVYHENNNALLYSRLAQRWLIYFRSSGSQARPILVTDTTSDVSFWPLETVRYKVPHFDPPASSKRHTELYKCAWIKSHCYDLVGRCVVTESDTLFLRNIDDLFYLDCNMAMCKFSPLDDRYKIANISPDLQCRIRQWKTDNTSFGTALMGGVQVHNVSISEMYESYFNRRQEDWIKNNRYNNGERCNLAITEFIFSVICSQIGFVIPHEYNWLHMWGDHPPETKVLHFAGDLSHKRKMIEFTKCLKGRSIL